MWLQSAPSSVLSGETPLDAATAGFPQKSKYGGKQVTSAESEDSAEVGVTGLGFSSYGLSGPMLVLVLLALLGTQYDQDFKQNTLIDSGSSISICSPQFASSYSVHTLREPLQARGIGGQESLNSFITILIKLDNRIVSQRIYVTPSLVRPLILGNDFLNKEQCLINYTTGQVRLGNTCLPMYLSDTELQREQAIQELSFCSSDHTQQTLPPGCVIVRAAADLHLTTVGYEYLPVTIDMRECLQPSTDYVFEFDSTFLDQHSVVGPGFVTTPEQITKIILSSIGPGVVIHKNTKVGYLSPISTKYYINKKKPAHQVFHTDSSSSKINGRPTRMSKEQLDSLQIASDLSPSELIKLKKLLSQYSDIFTWDDKGLSDLGCLNIPWKDGANGVRLYVKDHAPVFSKAYKMSMHERIKVKDYLEHLEKAGIISQQVCETTSPMLLVKKPNGSMRLVVDLRKVNALCIHDCQQVLPEVEDIFSLLSSFTHLTRTDLASGYFQIPLDDRDKKVTGTIHMDGSFVWNRVVMGVSTAPFIFSQLIRQLFHHILFKSLFAYLDELFLVNPLRSI